MQHYIDQVRTMMATALTGSVVRTQGMTAAVDGFPAPVGAVVEIERQQGGTILGEVIGFQNKHTIVFPYSDLTGVRYGHRVRLLKTRHTLPAGDGLLGRVINARGAPIDGGALPRTTHRVALHRAPPAPVTRPRIQQPLYTGIRAIDGLLTCGRGQRMGVFSAAGVGKSVMLGMMARYSAADVIVIGLIGERGREVNEFLERDLGPLGRQRSVVVVATSDEPAIVRVQAAFAATAVAEYFRDQGKDVLLIMDSVTRFAHAQREIGLALGEPPATRGYPPSVFGLLPRLVERAGCSAVGSITAFYSVLVEGDDTNEPISDTVRGLLDGHTILSRKIAARGHFPAIDVLESLSRLMTDICMAEQIDAAMQVRELLAAHRDHEDLISIGAYRAGSNLTVDAALRMKDMIDAYLKQSMHQPAASKETLRDLVLLAQQARMLRAGRAATAATAATAAAPLAAARPATRPDVQEVKR